MLVSILLYKVSVLENFLSNQNGEKGSYALEV